MARMNRIRMTEMEIIGMAAATEESGKAITALLDKYRGQLFPGQKTQKTQQETFEEEAKRVMAQEAQRVYVVKPASMTNSEQMKAALQSNNPKLRAFAAKEMKNELMAMARLRSRGTRKKLPPGVFHQGKKEESP